MLRAWKRANLELGAAIARRDGEEVELDPEAREQLRALGYID